MWVQYEKMSLVQDPYQKALNLESFLQNMGIPPEEISRAVSALFTFPTPAAADWPGPVTGIDNAGAQPIYKIPDTGFPPTPPPVEPYNTEPYPTSNTNPYPNNPTPDPNGIGGESNTYEFTNYPAAPSKNWTHDGAKVGMNPSMHGQEGYLGSLEIPPWRYPVEQSQMYDVKIPDIVIPPSFDAPQFHETIRPIRESIGMVREQFSWLEDKYLNSIIKATEKEGGKVYLVRAATQTITDHRTEGELRRRKLSGSELNSMARTATGNRMDINHTPENATDSLIFDSEYDPKRKEIQMLVVEKDPEIIQFIKDRKITAVSINGGMPRSESIEPCIDGCDSDNCEMCNVPKGVILGELDGIGMTWVVTAPEGITWKGQWIPSAKPGIGNTVIQPL